MAGYQKKFWVAKQKQFHNARDIIGPEQLKNLNKKLPFGHSKASKKNEKKATF